MTGTARDLRCALDQGDLDVPVRVVTAHGSFTFEVSAVERDTEGVVLRLREVGSTRDHWVMVDTRQWHVEHPLSCRETGLPNCKITRLVQVGVEVGHLTSGRRKVWLAETGVLLWDDMECPA